MSTMVGEVTERVRAGRETIGRSLDDVKDRVGPRRMSLVGIAAGALVALTACVVLAAYGRRHRRTLAQRLREVLPDQVGDIPEGIRVRLSRVR